MKFLDDSNGLNILNTTLLNSSGEWYITVPYSDVLVYTVLVTQNLANPATPVHGCYMLCTV